MAATKDDLPKSEVTKVLVEPWEADARLLQMGLRRKTLLEVVAVAKTEESNVTRFHCANAAGTFSYHYGTFSLRDKHVPLGWSINREDGVESIKHPDQEIKIAFCNVDVACDVFRLPKPRSEKGAGIERAAIGNLFGADLPSFAPKPRSGCALYYLMTDEGGSAELTRPVVRDGVFVGAVERIFLGRPNDESDPVKDLSSCDDATNNYDPIVTPKTGT